MEKDKMMDTKLIYETENFRVGVPHNPHVSREEGGHLWIMGKRYIKDRYDLSPKEATEVMRLTMLIGEAMIDGMKRRRITIERINFQDNGNWSYLRGTEPTFHIHLYGRVKNSNVQKWGEALNFPNPNTDFYDNMIPFNDEDVEEIKKSVSFLENQDKYKIENWNL